MPSGINMPSKLTDIVYQNGTCVGTKECLVARELNCKIQVRFQIFPKLFGEPEDILNTNYIKNGAKFRIVQCRIATHQNTL